MIKQSFNQLQQNRANNFEMIFHLYCQYSGQLYEITFIIKSCGSF